MTYKNKFKCTRLLWRGFGWPGRAVYNEVYGTMIRDQKNFRYYGKSHTASLLEKKDWEVVCHNAATTAAWAASRVAERLAA